MEQIEAVLARHDERITNLEDWRDEHERKQNSSLEKIFAKLDMLSSELSGRPTWAVSTMITTLSSLSVGLAVYLLTRR
ncbi:MAG: hypothetical protein ACPLPR_02180 [Bacillota bacterium]